MKKLQFFSLALAFLLVLVLVNAATISVNMTAQPGNGIPGDVKTGTFQVQNLDAVNPVTVNYELPKLTGPGGDITTSISGTITIAASATETRNFTITIPQKQSGLYTGTLTVTDQADSANTALTTVSLTINSIKTLDVLSSSYTVQGETDSDTNTKTIEIKNTGTEDLSNLQKTELTSSDLKDPDNNTIVIHYPSFTGTLAVGETKGYNFYATIPSNMAIGIYYADIKIYDGLAQDTVRFEIKVQPELCGVDANQDELEVTVQEPNNGDDFAPGDTINIESRVKNNGDDYKDITVQACLYNGNGDEIVCQESDETEVEDGRTEDFDFELGIPTDDDSMDEGKYDLYVFAYEDGDTEDVCSVSDDLIKIDFKRESNQVIAKDVKVLPSTVNQGDTISFVVELLNVGTKNEDNVYIAVKNPELKINVESEKYDLKKYSDSDNDATAKVSVVIPTSAKKQDYSFEVLVYYDSGDSSQSYFETVTVVGEPTPTPTETTEETPTETTEETTPITGAVTFYPTKLSSLFGGGTQSTVFWVIGDIVLLIIAIYFLTLIFRKR